MRPAHLSDPLAAKVKNLGGGAWITYLPRWLTTDEATALQDALTEQIPWEQRAIRMFGKEIMQPRLIGWGGELPYRYSGQTLPPRPLGPPLASLLERVNQAVGCPFNHVLLNRYRSGADAMGYHADDEPELGYEPVIAAISVGVRRRFVMKAKGKRKTRRTVELAHGSLFVMGGTMQHKWYHGVPRQGSVQSERINITFRHLMGPPGWRPPVDGRSR